MADSDAVEYDLSGTGLAYRHDGVTDTIIESKNIGGVLNSAKHGLEFNKDGFVLMVIDFFATDGLQVRRWSDGSTLFQVAFANEDAPRGVAIETRQGEGYADRMFITDDATNKVWVHEGMTDTIVDSWQPSSYTQITGCGYQEEVLIPEVHVYWNDGNGGLSSYTQDGTHIQTSTNGGFNITMVDCSYDNEGDGKFIGSISFLGEIFRVWDDAHGTFLGNITFSSADLHSVAFFRDSSTGTRRKRIPPQIRNLRKRVHHGNRKRR